jgi:hypothetical protein
MRAGLVGRLCAKRKYARGWRGGRAPNGNARGVGGAAARRTEMRAEPLSMKQAVLFCKKEPKNFH